ncbi:MAG TPA: hypothetical protein PKK82_02410 [Anaerolineaceae bacterium]|nr:hypothetical protein [Anaerolineaceae bacterium]
MKTYTLDQSQLAKEKKSIILMYGITLLVLIAIAVSINWGRETMRSLLWLIPMMIAMYVFMGIRSYKQRKAFYEGYKLELFDDTLVQNQPRMSELKFPLSDITNVEVQKKGMLISIKQAKNVLGVSKDVMKEGDYEELKTLLTSWAERNAAQAETVVDDAIEQAEESGETVVESTKEVVDDIKEFITDKAEDVAEAADQVADKVKDAVDDLKDE